MDRATRNLLLLAVVIIVALFLFSGRALPLFNGQEVDLDAVVDGPVAAVPTLDPTMNVDPSLNADVDASVEVNSISPGPLVYLDRPAGFPSGLLHGLISPFMLVASFFMPAVRMYATDNAGVIYDFGFLLGLLVLLALTQVRRFRYYRD